MEPFRVGILGATGLVGQRLVQQLARHPWFRLEAVAASDRSAGKTYAEVTKWAISAGPPAPVAPWKVRGCRPEELDDCDLVFSALDAGVAREIEAEFAAAGFAVVSNSSAFRHDDDVPLLIPEVNAAHLELLARRREREPGGFVVTNPNCSTTGLALVLAPLHRALGVKRIVVATLQAISGAGAEGPRALELVDNVLPNIPGEERKIERELRKILGEMCEGRVEPASIEVSAHCHRVPTFEGHLEAVSLETERSATPEDASRLLERFEGDTRDLELPSAPARVIAVRHEPDRPQPRLDRGEGKGMTVVVGRVRPCPVLGLKLVLLAHNSVRGAAGGTVLNAEMLAAKELLPRRCGR